MKTLLLIPATILLSGCMWLPKADNEVATCGPPTPAVETIYTKEGFPIIDDQAPIMFPCPTVPAPTPPTTPNPPLGPPIEPPVIDPPIDTNPKKEQCNSGRGNGSEGLPDCDPGKSGLVNKGGD